MATPAFKIIPGVQSYAWGKKGKSSLVAQFATECIPDFVIDENKKYAELWMGTHPSAPSRTATGLLSDTLKAHPEFIGAKVQAKFPETKNGQLPFLFKVLSIEQALSIQAHPDKKLAEDLHKKDPKNYPDDNHKPEMAIALTDFQAFLNFLPPACIYQYIKEVPEFAGLLDQKAADAFGQALGFKESSNDQLDQAADKARTDSKPITDEQREALKGVLKAFFGSGGDDGKKNIAKIKERYGGNSDVKPAEKRVRDTFLKLMEDHPDDLGLYFCYMLNIIDAKPGQAIYLGPNLPHAYINGDIIECMAQSDNVVRAGLTPKFVDTTTLTNMLTYDAGPAERQFLEPTEFNRDPSTLEYNPPIDEFTVLRTHLAKDEVTTHRSIDGPSIALITNGEAFLTWEPAGSLPVARGDVIFLAAGIEFKWQAKQDTEVFRAYVEA